MTAQTTATHDRHPLPGLFARAGAAVLRIAETIARSSQAARCAAEAERLFALSDAELARRGLRRDQVIQHAFGAFHGI